jgi:GT2 family glycosyltransferase
MSINPENPSVSIIIINYNTFELTSQCIRSIYEKTTGIDFEILVVDNASQECDPELFLKEFPKIKLIKSAENLGFAKGNNLGIKHAQSDVMLLLNSDTVLKNNAIKLCYNQLINRPEVGVVTCKLLSHDGSIQHQCNRFDRISLLLFERFRLHKLLPKGARGKLLMNGYFDHERTVYCERIWGTFFMFRKEMLKQLPQGKLSDRFFMYGEDYEWCCQINKYSKYKILYVSEAEILHLMGGSRFGDITSPEKTSMILKNRYICMKEYYGKFKTKLYFALRGVNVYR